MRTISRAKLARALAGVIVLCAGGNAFAQTFPDWVDPCGTALNSTSADATARDRLLGATVFLAPRNQLVPAAQPGYWRFNQQPPGGFNFFFNANYPLVPGSQFYGTQQMSANGRGGYLIGPDVVATASHGNFDPTVYAIVFNLRHKPDVNGVCQPPNLDLIPAADVAFPTATNSLIASPLDDLPPGSVVAGLDYAAFRIDKSFPNRFVRLRRTGNPEVGENFAFTSFPQRMTMKLSKHVGFLGLTNTGGTPPIILPRFTNYALMDGSSGGPLLNLSSGYVETSVGGPMGFGCMSVNQVAPGNIYAMSNLCPESPGYTWFNLPSGGSPNFNLLNAGDIKTFAQYVPAAELQVSPLGTVTQEFALGAAPPITTFDYTMHLDAAAPQIVMLDARAVAPPMWFPSFITMPVQNGMIGPGANIVATAHVSAANITDCGIYEQDISFRDLTYGFRDLIKHRLEVGLTEFALVEPESTSFQGVTHPYVPSQLTYTIRNVRSTPIQVRVANTAAWLRVDGQALPPTGPLHVTYNLAAKGSPGDSASIVVTVDNTGAAALTNGAHTASLTFSNQSTCVYPLAPSTIESAKISIDKGTLTLPGAVLDHVPETSNPAAALTGTVNVDTAFCVGGVDVKAGFLPQTTGFWFVAPFATWVPELELSLVNPAGTRVTLWNPASFPASWPYGTQIIETLPSKTLRFNAANPPPTGASLGAFANSPALGNWRIEARDPVLNSVVGFLTGWELKLTGTPGACPP